MRKMIVFCLMAIVMSVNVNAQSLKNKFVDDATIERQIVEMNERCEYQIRYGVDDEDKLVTLYDEDDEYGLFGKNVLLKDYIATMKKRYPITIKYYGLTFHKVDDYTYEYYGCTRDMCVAFVERFILEVKKGEEELMYFKYKIYHDIGRYYVEMCDWKEYKERERYWPMDSCSAIFRLNNISISYSGNRRTMTLHL